MYHAWRVFFKHDILTAGIALALLYMTVLAFDNLSRGKDLFLLTCQHPHNVFAVASAAPFPGKGRAHVLSRCRIPRFHYLNKPLGSHSTILKPSSFERSRRYLLNVESVEIRILTDFVTV